MPIELYVNNAFAPLAEVYQINYIKYIKNLSLLKNIFTVLIVESKSKYLVMENIYFGRGIYQDIL